MEKVKRPVGCLEKLYHNVVLPNGDVSLCCMDYGLEHIIGNLLDQEYEDVIPKHNTCFFNLCRFCEKWGRSRMKDLQELLNVLLKIQKIQI